MAAAAAAQQQQQQAAALDQQQQQWQQQGAGASSSPSLPGPDGAFAPAGEAAAAARQRLFNRIAPVYDELNDALSLGQHRVWKRMAVRWSGARPGAAALDVCCGSGDLAFELARAVGPSGSVTGLDFAAEMLGDAESRRAELERAQPAARPLARMTWVQVRAVWQ